MYKWS